MAVNTTLEYAKLNELQLDPHNPRLGREQREKGLNPEQLLELMKGFGLEELAVSFMETGFWPQEALMVVEEKWGKKKVLVVVEGNRRLAALQLLQRAIEGNPASRKWAEIAESGTPNQDLFTKIPYLRADSRSDIQSYIGFRHVTGIKQWEPGEKAEYIASLIDHEQLTYEQVMRRIGSKTPTVRQNYISYRLLLQMQDDDRISVKHVEEKFSVLYLSLRSSGVRHFLNINIQAEPDQAQRPVPKEKLDCLTEFAMWLFGNDDQEPVVTDSRLVDKFGSVLESAEGVKYLRTAEKPNFEIAYRRAGGAQEETLQLIERASYNVEQALSTVHLYVNEKGFEEAVERFGRHAMELLKKFPEVKAKVNGSTK